MENQAQTGDNMVTVTYDKDRKTVTFYDTFVDINGDTVKYDDIAIFQSEATDSSTMIYFYYSKSFSFDFDLTTYDGIKHRLKRTGYAAYGIGPYKRIKEEYESIAPTFYNLVLPKVGERVIDRIENGATANIGGLVITKDKMVYEKNKKKTYVITKSNFDRAVNNSSYAANYAEIYIRDEKKPIFRISLNEPNARLIVPIANYFFENRVN
jgi:hypothetical protein